MGVGVSGILQDIPTSGFLQGILTSGFPGISLSWDEWEAAGEGSGRERVANENYELGNDDDARKGG